MGDSHHLQQGMKEIKRKVLGDGDHPPDRLEREGGEEGDSQPEGVLGGGLYRFQQLQHHPEHSSKPKDQHKEQRKRKREVASDIHWVIQSKETREVGSAQKVIRYFFGRVFLARLTAPTFRLLIAGKLESRSERLRPSKITEVAPVEGILEEKKEAKTRLLDPANGLLFTESLSTRMLDGDVGVQVLFKMMGGWLRHKERERENQKKGQLLVENSFFRSGDTRTASPSPPPSFSL